MLRKASGKQGRRGTASPDDLSQERRREWRVRTRPELNERELLLVVDVDIDHAGACMHATHIHPSMCAGLECSSAADRQLSPACTLPPYAQPHMRSPSCKHVQAPTRSSTALLGCRFYLQHYYFSLLNQGPGLLQAQQLWQPFPGCPSGPTASPNTQDAIKTSQEG